MAAMATTLRALAVALEIRVVCIDQMSTLAVTPAADLFQFYELVRTRGENMDFDPYGERDATAERAALARMVSEAAGELGLAIMKPQKVDA